MGGRRDAQRDQLAAAMSRRGIAESRARIMTGLLAGLRGRGEAVIAVGIEALDAGQFGETAAGAAAGSTAIRSMVSAISARGR